MELYQLNNLARIIQLTGEGNGNPLQYSQGWKSYGQKSLADSWHSMGWQRVGHDSVTKEQQPVTEGKKEKEVDFCLIDTVQNMTHRERHTIVCMLLNKVINLWNSFLFFNLNLFILIGG